jgi:hypothetical protein
VDGAADLFLVGADRFEPGLLNGGRDDLGIDGIEIGDAAGGVLFLPKGISTKQSGASGSVSSMTPSVSAQIRPCAAMVLSRKD